MYRTRLEERALIDTPPVETVAASAEASPVPEAVRKLFQALNEQDVRYCHWKSNVRLEIALCGQTDLDLLVDRKQGELFRKILHAHNVKSLRSAPGKDYPAIESFLGFDPATGKLLHLHVHYQLVLGEQFVKNYRLPLEANFLDAVQLQHGVKVPRPELEIIVLAIRALLKYRDRDVLKDVLSIRSAGLPADILRELKHLLAKTSMDRIARTVMEVADVVPADIVLEFLTTVRVEPRAGRKFLQLRRRLRHAMRPYQRYHRLQATLKYYGEMWRRRKSLLKLSPSPKMTPANGGITVALLGPDGAGKSTMREILVKWLKWKLDVHVYYLGSKEPTRRSELLYICFRIARRSHREISRMLGEKNPISRLLEIGRDTLRYAHDLSIGWERYTRYRSGQKRALAGSIVLFDRYPLESISQGLAYPMMDGPRIPVTTGGIMGPISRVLSGVERNLYTEIRPPDYLFVFDVSPEVSLQRKPDHDRHTVEAKCRAVADLLATVETDPGRVNLIPIDADLPAEDVLSQLKTKLWEIL